MFFYGSDVCVYVCVYMPIFKICLVCWWHCCCCFCSWQWCCISFSEAPSETNPDDHYWNGNAFEHARYKLHVQFYRTQAWNPFCVNTAINVHDKNEATAAEIAVSKWDALNSFVLKFVHVNAIATWRIWERKRQKMKVREHMRCVVLWEHCSTFTLCSKCKMVWHVELWFSLRSYVLIMITKQS